MSRRQQITDQALKITVVAFLSLLAWQGKSTLKRIDTLEKNQTLILVHLGITPIAQNTLEIGVENALFATR